MDELSPGEVDFLRAVEQFATAHVRPGAARDDVEQRLDLDLVARLGDLGVLGLRFPVEYGGSGGSMLATTAALEVLARAHTGLATGLVVHLALGGVLLRLGTEEQRRRYLPRIVAGRDVCGIALTEADAGSDVRSMRSWASRDGDAWVVDGEKLFVTNGASAAFLLVAALVEDSGRLGWFLVERGDPGFQVVGTLDKLGLRASETASLYFAGCRVPADRLVEGDPEADGLAVAMEAMSQDRVLGASVAVGLAARALEEAVTYTVSRTQFGRPVAGFQSVRHTLADLATEVAAGRALVREAARRVDAALPYATEAAMAKLFTGRLVRTVCAEALELHGGIGFMNESAISRLYRDAPAVSIAGGTSNMQRDLIARTVTGIRE